MRVMISAAFLATVFSALASHAQMFQCPPGSRQVAGGGGTMCQCPDGSYAAGWPPRCQQQQQPRITAPIDFNQHVSPPRENMVIAAYEWISKKLVMDHAQMPSGVPLSFEVEGQNINAAPPTGYIAPWESSKSSPAAPFPAGANPFTGRVDTDTKGSASASTPPAFDSTSLRNSPISTISPNQSPTTTLPPPGQLGVTPQGNVTGFQAPTNSTKNNQSWSQKATNWFQCDWLHRC